jgi:hypothetical protein
LANITRDWVSGKPLAEIANTYFDGNDLTLKLSNACKAIYRDLANNAAWGLSALSKMPTAGLDFNQLSEVEKRRLNNLPAMLYHGVQTEEAVLMRMNSVPRSIAENIGSNFKSQAKDSSTLPHQAAEYLKSLSASKWDTLKPENAKMTGEDYQKIWEKLSGLGRKQ